ncbi:FecR family protein [Chitinophaga qingshengii]|uniref:FecR domain-containing protein n=1 Tax=Chitinophaga qingshengii TaxID=1569794 RepID=A0ABR7TQP1_9BACT|nr:FecR family protein [Chitinophaga qingshengii]MBC9932791.1 FecR domain-containing protein [Chitinophaga qingshengii]
MDEHAIKILFSKVLQQTASEEEKRKLALYLRDHDIANTAEELLPFEEWEAAMGGPLPKALRTGIPARILPVRKFYRKSLWYAAAVAVLLVTGLLMLRVYRLDKAGRMLYTTSRTTGKQIRLPDGSTVYLNADSRVQFSEDAHERSVVLHGEAFFDIVQQASKPFVVKSGNVQTTVLGTSFNIKAYPDENSISVAVKTGKVSVSARYPVLKKDSTIFLEAGQQAVYGNRDHLFALSPVDTAAICGWQENRFVFEDACLGDICKTLGRQYGVQFQLKDPALSRCIYSTTFNQLTLAEALEKLTLLGDLQFELQGKTVIVKGEPCHPL